SSPRPSRFQVKDNPSELRPNDRKIALLRALAQHRFLTAEQLAAIDGGSRQKIQRILRTLFDHELVVRPPAQRFQLASHENRPLVYSLTHAGARTLAQRDGASMREFNWTTKSKRRKAEHIVHAVD